MITLDENVFIESFIIDQSVVLCIVVDKYSFTIFLFMRVFYTRSKKLIGR